MWSKPYFFAAQLHKFLSTHAVLLSKPPHSIKKCVGGGLFGLDKYFDKSPEMKLLLADVFSQQLWKNRRWLAGFLREWVPPTEGAWFWESYSRWEPELHFYETIGNFSAYVWGKEREEKNERLPDSWERDLGTQRCLMGILIQFCCEVCRFSSVLLNNPDWEYSAQSPTLTKALYNRICCLRIWGSAHSGLQISSGRKRIHIKFPEAWNSQQERVALWDSECYTTGDLQTRVG